MAGNTFGKLFRVTTSGVSHGPGYLCIIDGCPAGLELSVEDLLPDLRRRRPGQSKLTTQRDESDTPEIWSGVFEGKTDGTPIGILFRNSDQRSGDYGDIKDKYRPGHADFTFDAKYGFRDYRGGGRSSARETVSRVAAGAVAKKILALAGIRVLGYVKQVGDVIADVPDPTAVTLEQVEATPARCPVPDTAAKMIALIDSVRMDRDSIGGVCELVATGVPPGLGEPVFDKLKADLGKALLSLPAVLGFEYGAGFAVANMRGSANNDVFVPPEPHESPVAPDAADCNTAVWEPHHEAPVRTESNRHGGMLGGISSGMPIVCRVAVKPTSSIPRSQRTVTRAGEPTEILVKGRHDPCLLPRFVPMGEAMIALVLVDHLLRSRASRLPG
ncbi:chorismate synthase : Chorismate synthase OS=Planctomyces limnophilus (strain ATCC 43296 / DSM 3776 / IFAM 1008 / 290) GN=aroC PE=3 SV=1: Chorismate_synt [Gemmata massiliana]|uniref:Chorismate synthase n=1 Tax=Gemmata massiliana TaxID=1210884 RepID=A0A6P2CV87_9BACT|nr:chorismate synthase [Gemmata massiliana]VTR93068.1 chorismate synthase : Chorismate synthase OS=Planctomyces limnophilus (strain ATCC 43296 / DSM 3776 / IFAM 1008 / 290) GN=aroC PE=3 SV=1: Chorismate_synt [Gemmata massiliana]